LSRFCRFNSHSFRHNWGKKCWSEKLGIKIEKNVLKNTIPAAYPFFFPKNILFFTEEIILVLMT